MGLAVRINSKIPTINDHVGRINFIDTVVNEDTQSIVAKARFPNHRGHLREGQFVTAVITWEVKPNTILVPTNALVSEGDKTYLFVVAGEFRPPQPELSWWQRSWGELMRLFSHPNGDRAPSLQKISKRRVQLGMIKGDRTEITEGLQSGQEYVTSGVQMLADGMPVRVLDSQREAL
jgi:multidrug efflux pump subunit AcrA (membrane-fusion protein)